MGDHHLGTQVLEPLVVHFFRDVPDEEAGRAAVHVGVLQLGVAFLDRPLAILLVRLGHGIPRGRVALDHALLRLHWEQQERSD